MQHAGIYAFFIGDKTSGMWRISAISPRHSTIGFPTGPRPDADSLWKDHGSRLVKKLKRTIFAEFTFQPSLAPHLATHHTMSHTHFQ
jgi:hypothetical protein